MKEKRFIELVNLYLDREISGEERAELEEALQKSSRRRAVFLSYTRLQHVSQKVIDRKAPQLSRSVDFHKYAELARNANQRIFRGFFVSAAALVLFALAVGLALQYLVIPSPHSEWAAAERRVESFVMNHRTPEPSLVEQALANSLQPLRGSLETTFFSVAENTSLDPFFFRDEWEWLFQSSLNHQNRTMTLQSAVESRPWIEDSSSPLADFASVRFKR